MFLQHRSSLLHDTGHHPEQPDRIVAIEAALSQREWLGMQRVTSPPATREQVTAVHPAQHLATIEACADRGGGRLDLDTVLSAGSFEAAMHAAGGAVRLVDMLLEGEAPSGFSAHRPPGHHATVARAMGFCLFNNIAIAARHALGERALERVLILDWDVHHGNGTNDIFHASQQVLFVSIHQSPLYPGTGPASDVGDGGGTGYTVNLPVPPGAGDAVYLSLLQHVVVPLARSFEPQLILVSAGYDAHRDDPLAECRVTDAGFAAMTGIMLRAARSLDAPLGCVLEGGYHLRALASSVVATLEQLVAGPDGAGEEPEVPLGALARAARERLREWWPAL